MERTRKLLIAWAGLLALAGQGCQQARSPGTDVLLICVDTLRPGHLGLYGYTRVTSPELERWLSQGSIFETAYSTEASTPPSVISILSGQLPQEHGVRAFWQLLPDDVLLLPDLLPPAYQTAAVVSSTVLTDEALGIADRFDHYDDFVDEIESERRIWERRASRTTDAALRWRGFARWASSNSPATSPKSGGHGAGFSASDGGGARRISLDLPLSKMNATLMKS